MILFALSSVVICVKVYLYALLALRVAVNVTDSAAHLS